MLLLGADLFDIGLDISGNLSEKLEGMDIVRHIGIVVKPPQVRTAEKVVLRTVNSFTVQGYPVFHGVLLAYRIAT